MKEIQGLGQITRGKKSFGEVSKVLGGQVTLKSMRNFFLNPFEFFLIVYPGLQSIDTNFYSQLVQNCKTIKRRNKFEDCEAFMLENAMLAKHHEIRKTGP